jgi:putative membrane protein
VPDRPDPTQQIRDEIHREGDAPRRTHLANERTFLAWWRSGLASITVGFGVGKFGPAVGNPQGSDWAYVTVGAGFVLLGAAYIAYGLSRRRAIDAALGRGHVIPSDDGWFTAFTAATLVLAAALLALLIVTA